MKNKFISIILLTALWVACDVGDNRDYLPESDGRLIELVILSDSYSLDSAFKNSVKDVFSNPIEGHPPPGEPAFKLLFGDDGFFDGYFKKHQNIIVLLHANRAAFIKKVLDPNLVDKLLEVHQKNDSTLGVMQNELFAKNQSIFFVMADNAVAMEQKLKANQTELLNIALRNEEKNAKAKLLEGTHVRNDVFYQKCIKNKNFGIRRSNTYRIAIDNEEFVWLRKSSTTEELEQGLFLFEAPYTSKEDLTTENLIRLRNELVKKYVPGEIEGSYMKYSDAFKPERRDQNFKGKYGVEIRGWWDVEGDFMGGPSHIRAVVDESRGRIVFAEGFVFHPNENKARPMRELEILVNTLSIK